MNTDATNTLLAAINEHDTSKMINTCKEMASKKIFHFRSNFNGEIFNPYYDIDI